MPNDRRTIICCGLEVDGVYVECDWALEDSMDPCPIGCPVCGSPDLLTIAGPGITGPANGPIKFQEPAKIPAHVKHTLLPEATPKRPVA